MIGKRKKVLCHPYLSESTADEYAFPFNINVMGAQHHIIQKS